MEKNEKGLRVLNYDVDIKWMWGGGGGGGGWCPTTNSCTINLRESILLFKSRTWIP